MDLLDLAVLALRITLLLILYTFVVVVIRASRTMLAEPTREDAAPGLTLRLRQPGSTGLKIGQILSVRHASGVGRSAGSDVLLADGTVSAQHAQFMRQGKRWVVRDLSSTNGTLVNGTLVSEAPVQVGDVVKFGDVELSVE